MSSVSAYRGRCPLIILLFLITTSSCALPTREPFNNRYIVYHNVPEDYFTAYETCRSKDMQLLTLKDDLETTLMFTKLKEANTKHTWIGATDLGHPGEWRWSLSGEKLTYISWAPEQPNNLDNDQHCMALSIQFSPGWCDYWCSRKINYFCEEESTPTTDTKCMIDPELLQKSGSPLTMTNRFLTLLVVVFLVL